MDKLKILFFGTPGFSLPALQTLLDDSRFQVCGVVTQPDKPAGRGQKLQISAVKELALKHALPVFQPERIRAQETGFLAEISQLGPIDFGVVIAFGQILPEATLNFPKFGCINIHASLLPRWRGAAPIQRALLAGDKETGVCIMQMEEGLDTGPVYAAAKLLIEAQDTTSVLHDKLASLGARLLSETLPGISTGSVEAQPQPGHGISYAAKISDADLKIDWQNCAETLLRQIRTFAPRPGAYTFLEGKRMKFLKAVCEPQTGAARQPGEIIAASTDSLAVQTGHGVLKILELQPEGKKAMSAGDFVRGYSGIQGSKLG